jgi:ubiquinone/menaquinone biosynthesis C-methylase UbiE
MKSLPKFLLVAVGSALAVGIAWRIASRRRQLPCPAWLGFLLENPLTEGIGGQALVERLALAPGMDVLDLGCGPGRLTIPVAQRVGPQGAVVGLDIQEKMLQRARARAAAAGLQNIHFVQAGAGAGALPHAAFDRAFLVTVLGEIPDQAAALAEVYLALKPGGLLSITEIFPDPHYQTRGAVRRLAAGAGFQELQAFGNPLAFTLNFVKPG